MITEEGLRKALAGPPIVFEKNVKGKGKVGELVDIEFGDMKLCGMWDETGPVRLRLLLFHECPSTPKDAFEELIENSYRVRELNGAANWEAYRLVNGDGDMLSGLIVDVYKDVAVLQSSSRAIDVHISEIAEIVKRVTGVSSVYEKSVQRVRRKVGLEPREGFIIGNVKEVVVDEEGVKMYVNVTLQKTGLYLDQRENRVLFGHLSYGRVLDLFSYTGGFGLHALHNGASKVKFVDEDPEALSVLRINLKLNGVNEDKAEIVQSDVWSYLRIERGSFDSMSVDPPAFIPSKEYFEIGVKDYLKAYSESLKRLEIGGIAALSSCSQPLTRDKFLGVIGKATRYAKSHVRIFKIGGASRDHVTLPQVPYLEYLKTAFLVKIGSTYSS
ncbi:SAM-dependent methyltransferase [Ignicoccus islandicus DSM 13165]|uniref:SAM-dependent methyltransferase n=1 Tax=Ignicoccus islandicus DSM 13165 TaxID=940295 RepID=A0A0U3G0C1_9CREN|nr:class I SAM-dependent rRNA methyltransferase [Ignicoccus islandicus]ALU11772.1 SAM-dependent methyltransferase [Ignicoccus islandicus DSM 13165]